MDNSSENAKTKIRRCQHYVDDFESKHGPTFSLSTFKKFADNFKAMYFNCVKSVLSSDEKWEPSVENIEGEYGRIIQNPTHQIEVHQRIKIQNTQCLIFYVF